ncbi:hypothetical protein [Jannaschia sp. 2305UL9-9]|uniref:tetratricopeptide repeat protein n=1 Tax=Jannaschia sp. 2305UL9-9 TaxID=3121638 RepID=UPI0035270A32
MTRTTRAIAAFVAATLTTGAAIAQCPEGPDIEARLDILLDEVRAAPSEREARLIGQRLWSLWATAPDAHAQDLLDEGMARRAAFDLRGALIAFDALVAYCPDYAEGYNQRAFANFIRSDFEAALPDLDRAIALQPRHVAALAGRGLTLISLGRVAEGQAAIRDALVFNPWLTERRFLTLPTHAAPDGTEL